MARNAMARRDASPCVLIIPPFPTTVGLLVVDAFPLIIIQEGGKTRVAVAEHRCRLVQSLVELPISEKSKKSFIEWLLFYPLLKQDVIVQRLLEFQSK